MMMVVLCLSCVSQMDLIDNSQAAAVEDHLRNINSTATIIRTTSSRVNLSQLLNRGAYRLRLLDHTTQQQLNQQQPGPATGTAAAGPMLRTPAQQHAAAAQGLQLPGALQEPLAWLGERMAHAAGSSADAGVSCSSCQTCSEVGCNDPAHHHHQSDHQGAAAAAAAGGGHGGSSGTADPSSSGCTAHDLAVRTIALRTAQPVHLEKFTAWVEQLLWEQPGAAAKGRPTAAAVDAAPGAAPGAPLDAAAPPVKEAAATTAPPDGESVPAAPQLLRMKGLLRVAGSPRVHLFQAVYDLYDIAPGSTWQQLEEQQQQPPGATGPLSRLVLIGKGLDQAALQAAFEQCCEPS